MIITRVATYTAIAFGFACYFSPFGWGYTHPPKPGVNVLLSLGLFVMVGIVGIRTIQSCWRTATYPRWPMIIVASILVAGTALVGAGSLLMQRTSAHYQWTYHMRAISISLGILAVLTLQWWILKRIEQRTMKGKEKGASQQV